MKAERNARPCTFLDSVHCEHIPWLGTGSWWVPRPQLPKLPDDSHFTSWDQEPKLYQRSWHSNPTLNSLYTQKGRNSQLCFWHLSLHMVSSLLFGSLALFFIPDFSVITIASLLHLLCGQCIRQTLGKHLCSSVHLLKRLKINVFSMQKANLYGSTK